MGFLSYIVITEKKPDINNSHRHQTSNDLKTKIVLFHWAWVLPPLTTSSFTGEYKKYL